MNYNPLRAFVWFTKSYGDAWITYARLPATVLRHVRDVVSADEGSNLFGPEDYEDFASWLDTATPGGSYGGFGPVYETVCIDLRHAGGDHIVEDWEEAESLGVRSAL